MGGITTCPLFNPNRDCPRTGFETLACDKLLTCMNHAVNAKRQGTNGVQGLKRRFDEQIHGPCGPNNGPRTWKNHDDQIEGNQDKLTDYAEHYSKKCGEPPSEVLDYATKRRPQPHEWKGTPGKICAEGAANATAIAAAATVATLAAKATAEAAAETLLELLPLLLS